MLFLRHSVHMSSSYRYLQVQYSSLGSTHCNRVFLILEVHL